MKHVLRALCLVLLTGLPGVASGQSPEDAWDVRILPGWRAADGSHIAAIEVTLAEGWKTYWRAPGDGGFAPIFDWRESRNLGGVEITWPTPKAILQGGLQVIGYSDRVILPIRIAPRRRGEAVQLAAKIELGVCRDVCIPVSISLSEALLPTRTKPDARIAAAMADRPYSASEAGVGRVICTITPQAEGVHLRAQVDLPSTGGREVAVIETDNPLIWVGQADTRREGGRLIAETTLQHVSGQSFAVNRAALRITVLGKSHAVDIQGCPSR